MKFDDNPLSECGTTRFWALSAMPCLGSVLGAQTTTPVTIAPPGGTAIEAGVFRFKGANHGHSGAAGRPNLGESRRKRAGRPF